MAYSFLHRLRGALPKRLRPPLTYIFHGLRDVIGFLTGNRGTGLPPYRLMVGGKRTNEEFRKTGDEFFRYMRDICGLLPHERVLDIGCGTGQKMFPLLEYLNDEGGYDGFDLDPRRIKWLTTHVTRSNSNFRFQVCDVYNGHYNPGGRLPPGNYRFPYRDCSFDLVICMSVFTHMLPADVRRYFSEIRRVLQPGGRCLLSFFLLDEESRGLMLEGKSDLVFKFEIDGCSTTDRRVPETAVAFDESAVSSFYKGNGLSIQKPVFYGSWSGRRNFLSYQDLIVAVKE